MKFTKLLEDIYASQYKIKKVHSQNPTTGEWEWHDNKVRTARINFKNSKMHGEPAQKDDKDMTEEKTTGATKLVHTRKGADGAKYHIMQDSPTDYSLHREHGGKTTHIDTYSSLHRAKSVLDNEVKEEVQIDEDGYGRNKGYAHGFASPHAPSLGGRREREDDEGWDREPKQADHPHAVHINGRKWKSFGSKSHAQNVAKKIDGATVHREETDMNIDDQINEVLSKDATAGDWIHDFVHSDNPKFADKSKDKRKEMALAAYYAKQRNEEVELEEGYDKSSEHHKNARKMAKDYDGKATFHPNGHAEVRMRSIVHGYSTLNPKGTTLMSGEDLANRASKEHGKGKVQGNVVYFKEAKDEQEYGYEGDMALNQLATLTRCAEMIKEMLKPDTDMPEWVQSKITLATDYIQTAADYMYSEMNEEVKDEYARKVDKHLKNKYAPVAPVPDRKYIKGTPENKALKLKRRPINGMPTEETMKSFKEVIQSIQEANHREFAQQGKMHPDMAKHMVTGHEFDFYHPKTGDKTSGIVKHKSDSEVHIKAHKDGILGAGDVHKFTISSEMNEALKGSQHKLDKNKNGKVDAHDFKILRGEQEVNKEEVELDENISKMSTDKLKKHWDTHKDQTGASPVFATQLKKVAKELAKRKALNQEEVETRTVSFSDFITQLNEYTPGKDGVTRIQGRSYGAQYRDPEGADDAEDKKKQVAKPEPEVKRGRGRPAGSKSGANQKVTSGTKRSGVDYSGYKLHLPNSNR